MGRRSRKRRPAHGGAGEPADAGGTRGSGARVRAGRQDPPGGGSSRAPRATAPAGQPGGSRAERRNAEARARLQPLEPGERPGAVLAAVVVAGALGLGNLIAFLAGAKIQGKSPGPGALGFTVVMLVAAAGMWSMRYWAVLGFQALLALIILTFSVFLVRAANVEALALSVAVIGLGGWLFWKLVRALARIQMPTRTPGSGPS